MKIFLIYISLHKCISDTVKQLHEEDVRMARHLINEGMKVTHPDYPFLNTKLTKTNKETSDKIKLDEEDVRMIRHLKSQGFTVN